MRIRISCAKQKNFKGKKFEYLLVYTVNWQLVSSLAVKNVKTRALRKENCLRFEFSSEVAESDVAEIYYIV